MLIFKDKSIELTEYQKVLYAGLNQYINGGARHNGKTFVSCICFIEKAFNNLGERVEVFDHDSNNSERIRHVYHMIQDIFNNVEGSENYILTITGRFKCITIRRIADIKYNGLS